MHWRLLLLAALAVCGLSLRRLPAGSSKRLGAAVSVAVAEDAQPEARGLWPCYDALDRRILALALPAVLNFAIAPLVGATDTLFVGRMGDPLALAGQGAANQLFSSAFWVLSFFPSVVTPMVAAVHGAGDQEALRARVGEAMLLGAVMGLLGTLVLVGAPERCLSAVLQKGAPAFAYAVPYLAVRGATFLPAILSTICFATLRGTLDVMVRSLPLRHPFDSPHLGAAADLAGIESGERGLRPAHDIHLGNGRDRSRRRHLSLRGRGAGALPAGHGQAENAPAEKRPRAAAVGSHSSSGRWRSGGAAASDRLQHRLSGSH